MNKSTTIICERCQASYVIEPDAPTVCPECGHTPDDLHPLPGPRSERGWFSYTVVATLTLLGGGLIFGLVIGGYFLHQQGILFQTAMGAIGAMFMAAVAIATFTTCAWIVYRCVMLPFDMLRHLERQTRLLEEIKDRLPPS